MAAPFAAAGNRLCDNKINLIFPTELATGTIVEATSELLERTKYNTIYLLLSNYYYILLYTRKLPGDALDQHET